MTDSVTYIAKMAQNLQNLTQTQRKLNTNSYTSKAKKLRLDKNSKQFQLNMIQKHHILNANLTQVNPPITSSHLPLPLPPLPLCYNKTFANIKNICSYLKDLPFCFYSM